MRIMFPFIFLILLSPHIFVEYQVQTYVGNCTFDYLILEEVDNVNPNGTFTFTLYTVFLNSSEISNSTMLDNLTCPKAFFYIPSVGKEVINRGITLTLVNKTGDYFVYTGYTFLSYVGLRYYYYVNSSGVPSKIIICQFSVTNGKVVSKSYYKLISSNIINSSEKPIIPSGLKPFSGEKISFSSLNDTLGSYIVLFNLFIIPAVVIFKVIRHEKDHR
jgi:hypothetical protein